MPCAFQGIIQFLELIKLPGAFRGIIRRLHSTPTDSDKAPPSPVWRNPAWRKALDNAPSSHELRLSDRSLTLSRGPRSRFSDLCSVSIRMVLVLVLVLVVRVVMVLMIRY